MKRQPTFAERLQWEKDHKPVAMQVLAAHFSGTVRDYTTATNDRGIDAILDCGLLVLFVDLKLLGTAQYSDISIEYEAHGKPGWTVDPDKATDLVVFYWVPTGEMKIYRAASLRLAALDNQRDWLARYGNKSVMQRHGSLLAYVPPAVVEAAMTPDALVYGLGG